MTKKKRGQKKNWTKQDERQDFWIISHPHEPLIVNSRAMFFNGGPQHDYDFRTLE